MTSVITPNWWSFLASHYFFTDNSVGGSIDDQTLLSDLQTYVVDDLSQLITPAFLSNFSHIVTPSGSLDASDRLIATDGNEEIFIGYGGMDYFGGTSGDNIFYGGSDHDFFSPGGGIDLVIGTENGETTDEKDTVSYLTAISGITVLSEYDQGGGGTGGGSGLLPNQDVYVLTYDDWVNGPVQRISNFEVGADGDFIDVSSFLQAVGYTGTDPVADGYVRLKNISSGMKIQFDPDGFGGVSPSYVAVIEGLTVAQFSVQDNLWIDTTPPGGSGGGSSTGSSFLTYVIDDGHGAYDILYDVENIIGSDFSDTIHGHTVEDNLLMGMKGDDFLFGEGGNDILIGGKGLDTVDGGDGNDLILIGQGGDQVTGGEGIDIFKFDATIGPDFIGHTATILDFELGAAGDKLDLSEILIYGGYEGSDALGDGVVSFIQDGADTNVVIDFDGTGSGLGQTLAVLQNIQADQISAVNDLVLSSAKTLLVSILGQSNAEGLRVLDVDADSGVTRMQDQIEAQADFTNVVMPPLDENGKIVMQAVGGTRAYSESSNDVDNVWWFLDQNRPADLLIRAVDMMANQIAEQRALGAVKPVVVWGQGESDALPIGQNVAEADRLLAQARYLNATLAVFDYIKDQLGDDIEFYIMQTGRYGEDAALLDGISPATVQNTAEGLTYIRAAQEDIALTRDDVKLAVNYDDLPLLSEVDPVNYGTDTWHFHSEERELIGDRIGDFIA
ncbi:MAG: type I secretion C-terminal target domain-containing protein, partial [Alphaproteobacteria bacterium]|nr:type I secretion C-terminal target domain-containing protein [Alphaproteobacteria bacterium]